MGVAKWRKTKAHPRRRTAHHLPGGKTRPPVLHLSRIRARYFLKSKIARRRRDFICWKSERRKELKCWLWLEVVVVTRGGDDNSVTVVSDAVLADLDL